MTACWQDQPGLFINQVCSTMVIFQAVTKTRVDDCLPNQDTARVEMSNVHDWITIQNVHLGRAPLRIRVNAVVANKLETPM